MCKFHTFKLQVKKENNNQDAKKKDVTTGQPTSI